MFSGSVSLAVAESQDTYCFPRSAYKVFWLYIRETRMKIEIVSMFTLRPVRKSHISVWLIPPVLPAIVVLAGLHISQFGLFLQSCLPLLFLQGFTYLSLAYSSSPACHCCSCRASSSLLVPKQRPVSHIHPAPNFVPVWR